MLGSGKVSQQRQMENSPLGLLELLRAKKLLQQMISYVDICSKYSHLFQNFPQFIVIHTVKGFSGTLLLFP